MAVTTNEWLPASGEKWKDREVLCLFSDGHKEVCTWNGMYWQHKKILDENNKPVSIRIEETVSHHITHFYIFEKFNENNIAQ